MQALVVGPRAAGLAEFVSNHPDPRPPEGEVLIRVRLAGICSTDLELARGYMDFAGIPGHEFVGDVLEGPAPLVGRRVVGEINCVCGRCDLCAAGLPTHCRNRTVLGIVGRDGAFAELLCLPAANCHVVPDALSDEQTVFVEPLAAAVQIVKRHEIGESQRVAVVGSGRLGLLVAQVLSLTGCELEIIGRNPRTLALCRGWNLRTATVDEVAPAADRDVVVECSGSSDGFELAAKLVRPRGTIVLKSTYAGGAALDLAPVVIHEITVAGNRCGPFPDAINLLATGRIRVDELVSATWPLSRGVEAFDAARDPHNVKVLLRPGTS